MKKAKIFLVVFLIVVLAVAGFFVYTYLSEDKNHFTKTSLIKFNVPERGQFNSSLVVYNPEETPLNFKVYLNDFKEVISLSENEFKLNPNEEKDVEIKFEDSLGIPKIYIGKLIIESSSGVTQEIPIVAGVEDPNNAFAIIQDSIPKYDDVVPGGKLGVETKVYDLVNLGVETIHAEHKILDLNREILKTGESNVVVGSGSKGDLFDIPDEWDEGYYILITTINYQDTTSFSSYIFEVSKENNNLIADRFLIFVIAVLVFVLGIFALVFYFIRERDSYLAQLKSQQGRELIKKVGQVDKYKKDISKSEKNKKRKKSELNKLKKFRKGLIRKIKDKQKAQRKEIKELKKRKKKREIKKKLKKWKNESKSNKTGKSVKSQIKAWNKKGLEE